MLFSKRLEDSAENAVALAERVRRRNSPFTGRHEFTESIGRSMVFRLIPPETMALMAQTTVRASL